MVAQPVVGSLTTSPFSSTRIKRTGYTPGKARKQSQQSQPCSQCSLKKRERFVEKVTNLYAAFLGDECVLLNVKYLLGQWRPPFYTANSDFHIPEK